MPQIDLKYSSDLSLDVDTIFEAIEQVINQSDSSAGACKSRAYPAVSYKHTHVLVEVALLRKPHRDEAFTQGLLIQLQQAVAQYFPKDCWFALDLCYAGNYYVTTKL